MKKRYTFSLLVCLASLNAVAQSTSIPVNAHLWCGQIGVSETIFEVTFVDNPAAQFLTLVSGDNGHALIPIQENIPASAVFRITPSKDDNPLGGLTTFDLAEAMDRIERHLDGSDPFSLVEQWFGADVNTDGTVTQADVDLLYNGVLGITNEPIPAWRFVPKSFAFENPAMPLFPVPPGFIEGTVAELNTNHEFWAFRIGRIPDASPCELTGTVEIPVFSAYDASPNPTEGGFEIEVDVPRPVRLRGEVFEISGKVIWQQPAVLYPAGISTFVFDVDLIPGTYLWKISDPQENFQIGRIVRE